MNRREFLKGSLAGGIGLASTGGILPAEASEPAQPGFQKVEGVTRYVAEFIGGTAYGDLPADVIELGKKSILDGLGLALAGSATDPSRRIRRYIDSLGCGGTAAVLGTAERCSARFAALANGIAIHVDDFDDTQLSAAKDRVYGLLVHPTVCVLPAALGGGALSQATGRELMLAYHLGIEVECKIAEAISPRHYQDGFHSTGTCGVFGSAAATAKIRRLDHGGIVQTLAIAGSQACGLRENFGTMMKPFQAGHSAEMGIVAADLAQVGWTGAPNLLEAANGFFHAYGGSYDPSALVGKLGRPWTFASPGVSIKPFPSGSLTHPGMSELSRMIATYRIQPGDVESVEVGTNHNMPNTLIHHRPKDSLQAKFSMEFCLAILLVEGKAGLAQFTDAVVNRPDVQAMIGRIRFYTDPEAEAAGYDKMTTLLKVHLKDGRTVAGRADFGKGSPADPMTFEDVAEKFRNSAGFAGWPAESTGRIVETVRRLEDLADTRTLVELCRKPS